MKTKNLLQLKILVTTVTLTLSSLLFLNFTIYAQNSQGPVYPNSASSFGSSGIDWNNESYITDSEPSYDFGAYLSFGSTTDTTKYLMGNNFKFSIPPSSTITGIKLTICSSKSSYGNVSDYEVRLVDQNGDFLGDNKASVSPWVTIDNTSLEYGGQGDLWNTTWTPEMINNTNFGAALSLIGYNTTVYIRYIQLTVYYNCTESANTVYEESSIINSNNAIGLPDLNFASIGYTGFLSLDLTGGGDLAEGENIYVSWQRSVLSTSSNIQIAGLSSSGSEYVSIGSFLVDFPDYNTHWQTITLPTSIRYLKFTLVDGPGCMIDAVTYACDCTTPATPGVSVENNCGESVLTATGYTGDLLWSTGETTASITVNSPGTYTVTQQDGSCVSLPGSGIASPKTIPTAPGITVQSNCGYSVLTATNFSGELLWSTGENTDSITVTNDDTYSVTQTVDGCTSEAGSTTVVISSPEAGTISGYATICTGGTAQLSVNDNSEEGIWGSLNTDVATIDSSGVVTGIAAGTTTITYTVTDAEGCSDVAEFPITVKIPSQFCHGSAYSVVSSTGVINPENILGEPDDNVAVLDDYIDQIIVDVTGGPLYNESYINIRWRDGSQLDGTAHPVVEYYYSQNGTVWFKNYTYTVTSEINFATQQLYFYQVRYIKFILVNSFDLDIDAITYSCPCTPPATPGVTVQNNCGSSVLTATGVSGKLLWSTGDTTASITVTNDGTYTVTQTVDECVSVPAETSVTIQASPIATAPSLGDGTSGNPYQIATLENLYWISANPSSWDSYFIQTADIDASETADWCTGGWLPIGNYFVNIDLTQRAFSGNYDGQGHTISGLHIVYNSSYVAFGLFGTANGATIMNLNLANVNVNISSGGTGALVGYAYTVSIDKCSSSGDIVGGADNTGGLVGSQTQSSSISNSYSTCNVSGTGTIGGLIGSNNYSSMITNSYHSLGTVYGIEQLSTVGGLLGANFNDSEISKCYSEDTVIGYQYVGGLVAANYSLIENCYSRSTCSSLAPSCFGGGLVGLNGENSIVNNCYSTGTVGSNMQGFIGNMDLDAAVKNSFWDTETSGTIKSEGGIGKTTAEMKTDTTFTNAGWDFETIWAISADKNDGYPNLEGPVSLPVISSFSPATGPVGTLITITGSNLDSLTSFTVGGTAAIVVSNTGTTLVGMVMPGAVTGNVSITTTEGTVTNPNVFTVTPTPFPSIQQGEKLVGSDPGLGSDQGGSVSVSADGNTAIVGGDYDNYGIGAAWIYTREGDVWAQQGNKLVANDATGAAGQGFSVSLSADGNTAIVGGYTDNSGKGAAWIFTREGNVWTQQGSKLVANDAIGSAHQGTSVSISADGNKVIVGGNLDNSGKGAAWIYTRTGNTWTQQGSKLVGTGATTSFTFQGISVALSADGNTAIVGGLGDNSAIGAAWIYTLIENTWIQQGSKLTGSNATVSSQQGRSVSLSADGNTAIVGGFNDNSGVGAVWIFTREGNVWTQQGSKLVANDASGAANQGISVSISADGNTAIVGGSGDNSSNGAAWIFTRNENIWSQQGSKLVGTGASGTAHQGISVGLSTDGNTAFIGGDSDDSNGAAWPFISSSTLPASVSIEAVPAGAVCEGTSVTFTAAPVNGGTPSYQWMKNGTTVEGETGSTFTTSTLVDNDAITVVMTSSLPNATGSPATSNSIVAEVDPLLTPSVTINSSDDDNQICSGTEVTFTATPNNTGGGTVAYKWFLNEISYDNEEWSQNTWSTNELEDGDSVTCVISVTDGSCLTTSTARSSKIVTSVYNHQSEPLVNITSNVLDNTICKGMTVTFTATTENTNGGNISYAWKQNGNSIGFDQNTYTTDELEDGDKVSCEITVSNALCLDAPTATSDTITTIVDFPNAGQITGSNVVCAGSSVDLSSSGDSFGYWTNLHPNITSVSESGVVTGIEAGIDTIVYIVVGTGLCEEEQDVAFFEITVSTPPNAPNAEAQSFCSGDNPTVHDLVVFGEEGATFNWYDVSEEGVPLSETDALLSGIYYASQTVNGCESARTSVEVTVNTTPSAPTAEAQSFCNDDIHPLADLVIDGDANASFNYYSALVGGTALSFKTSMATGTYYISQTVDGCEGPRTAVSVTINDMPEAGELEGSQLICAGTSDKWYTFEGEANGTWSSDNTAVASVSESGEVTGVASGTATISYTVEGSGGCEGKYDVATMTVSVVNPPNAGKITGPGTLCIGETAQLTSDGDQGGSWTSLDDDVLSIDNKGLVTAVRPGTASISYIVEGSGGCKGDEALLQITVFSNSEAPNSITSDTPTSESGDRICPEDLVTLSVEGGGLGTNPEAEWTWYEGDCGSGELIGTGKTLEVQPTETTTYTVRAEGGCNETSCASVTVWAWPHTEITEQPSDAWISYGCLTKLEVVATGNDLHYQWYQNDFLSNTGGDPITDATSTEYWPDCSNAGEFYYYVVVTGTCSTVTSNAVSLTIDPQAASASGILYYTGPKFAFTQNENSGTATIMLSATIKNNVIQVCSEFGGLAEAGDIRTALISFEIDKGNGWEKIPGATNLPVNYIDPNDISLGGSAAALAQIDIGDEPGVSCELRVIVTGNYTGVPSKMENPITIVRPQAGGIITGTVGLCNDNSAGFVKGMTGDEYHTVLNFEVKYSDTEKLKGADKPKGKVWLLVASLNNPEGVQDGQEHTYLIASNAIADLAIENCMAHFTAKANVVELLEDGAINSLEGNCTMVLDLEKDETCDKVGITVYRAKAKGGIWYSNNWSPLGKTLPECICEPGFEIGGCNTALASVPEKTKSVTIQPEIEKPEFKVYPNPFSDRLNFEFVSPVDVQVRIDIYDLTGKLVKTIFNAQVDNGVTYNADFKPNTIISGMYFYRTIMGESVYNGKVIYKQ